MDREKSREKSMRISERCNQIKRDSGRKRFLELAREVFIDLNPQRPWDQFEADACWAWDVAMEMLYGTERALLADEIVRGIGTRNADLNAPRDAFLDSERSLEWAQESGDPVAITEAKQEKREALAWREETDVVDRQTFELRMRDLLLEYLRRRMGGVEEPEVLL